MTKEIGVHGSETKRPADSLEESGGGDNRTSIDAEARLKKLEAGQKETQNLLKALIAKLDK